MWLRVATLIHSKLSSLRVKSKCAPVRIAYCEMEHHEPEPDFVNYNELASKQCGGKVLFATDDFFATAENLLKDEEPVWKEGEFTEFGKWMDGWETRRKRCAGHDWAIIELKTPATIKGICVDTCYFSGNFAPKFSLTAANLPSTEFAIYQSRDTKMGSAATEKDYIRVSALQSEKWKVLVPQSNLQPGYPETRKSYFRVFSNETWTHLRLNIFPDGGIARIRVYGVNKVDLSKLPSTQLMDLASKEVGGLCLRYSDAHYGHPRNLIKTGNSIGMADGWETARRLDRSQIIEVDSNGILQVAGEEWAIFQLGCVGRIFRIEVDTTHFKGNYPDNVKIEGAFITSESNEVDWLPIIAAQKLSPDTKHCYTVDINQNLNPVSHVKVIIAPDGGLSRLRIWGYRL